MKKSLFTFILSLAIISGAPIVIAQSPGPVQGQSASAQNLGLQNLPIPHPIKTIESREGVLVQILGSQMFSTSQLYYTPIPEVKIDKKNCFDPKSKTFTVKVGFPCKTEEVSDLLKSDGFDTKLLVQMPLVGYEIAVSYGNESQVIRYFNGSVQILGEISCSAEIANEAILKALNANINSVNVEVKIICDYQKLLGSSARMGFESQFKQKLHERILADHSEVYMSRDSFKQLTRDVSNNIQSSVHNSGYMIVIGDGVNDLIDECIKQNPNMFVEKTIEEMGELTGSYFMYDPEFGVSEIKPDEISDIKNEWEKLDEKKQEMENACKVLKEARQNCKNVEEFKKRVSESDSFSVDTGGSVSICGIIDVGGEAGGSYSSTSDQSSSRHSLSWKDLYDMSAKDSFSKESFYNKSMEKFKGEVRKVASLSKDYKVMRVGAAELNSISDFYCQKSTIDVTAEPLTFQTSIEKAMKLNAEAAAWADLHDLSIPGKCAGQRKTVVINGVEFAFRWCPAGNFIMGSPDPDKEHKWIDEKQHNVTLTKGFWMMETEITQRQWKAIMSYNPSHNVGDDLPVDNVSWFDCQVFCKKCEMLGFPVTLPTEAQWEHACRAGSTGAYPGNNLNEIAWHTSNSGGKTHPVAMKKPNAWGLYDLIGNVWEWCHDWYGDYPSGSVINPSGPNSGLTHVARGAAYDSGSYRCRSAARTEHGLYYYKQVVVTNPNPISGLEHKSPCYGFRCVVMPK